MPVYDLEVVLKLLLEQLEADLADGKLVVVATKDDPPDGLVGNHGYTVVDVSGNMVDLYNPWGGIDATIHVSFESLLNDTRGFQVR